MIAKKGDLFNHTVVLSGPFIFYNKSLLNNLR